MSTLEAVTAAAEAACKGEPALPPPLGTETEARLWAAIESLVAQLQGARAQLREAQELAALADLAGGLAHEMSSPLACVMSNVDYARSELPKLLGETEDRRVAETYAALEEALQGSARVRDIIAGLRAFARPAEGPEVAVDARHVVEEALVLAGGRLRRRVHLQLKLHETPPVRGHPGVLGQALLHVLDHVIRRVPDDGRFYRVEIATEYLGGAVAITVRDDVRGIPAAEREHLLDERSGAGPGLPVAARMLASMGGRLEVHADEDATFRLLLPSAVFEDLAGALAASAA